MQNKIHDALQSASLGLQLQRETFMELYNDIFSKSIGDSALYALITEEIVSILSSIPITNLLELETQYLKAKRIDATVVRLLRSRSLLLSLYPYITVYASKHLQQILHNLPLVEMAKDLQ